MKVCPTSPTKTATESLTTTSSKAEKFVGNDGKLQQGIRKILHDRNKLVLEKSRS